MDDRSPDLRHANLSQIGRVDSPSDELVNEALALVLHLVPRLAHHHLLVLVLRLELLLMLLGMIGVVGLGLGRVVVGLVAGRRVAIRLAVKLLIAGLGLVQVGVGVVVLVVKERLIVCLALVGGVYLHGRGAHDGAGWSETSRGRGGCGFGLAWLGLN